jgi:hypothetical protein
MFSHTAPSLAGWAMSAALLLVIGCDAIPRDPRGTLERVRATKVINVGVIATGPASSDSHPQQVLLSRLGATTGAALHVEIAAAERVLSRLERGDLDLVVGEMADDSPWRGRVTLLPPLVEPATEPAVVPTVAARNGENAWISLLSAEISAVKGGGS